jgi:hypothetical protein
LNTADACLGHQVWLLPREGQVHNTFDREAPNFWRVPSRVDKPD